LVAIELMLASAVLRLVVVLALLLPASPGFFLSRQRSYRC